MKILLTGGGTLGSVTPLLALVEVWREQKEQVDFMWVGTSHGPERTLVEQMYQIPFRTIATARLPRYPSIEWLLFPFRFVCACAQSIWILIRERPQVIIGAGGYTQVPLMIAGWFFRVSCFILQPDIDPLLSNRLVAGIVKRIFVAWQQSKRFFPAHKTDVVGNPVRPSLFHGSKERAHKRFGLDLHKPTLLVYGGGSGARWINASIRGILERLIKEMNVIHVTGVGKEGASQIPGYITRSLCEEELKDIYSLADVVVGRAGMGTITEVVALQKPTIFIPLNETQMHNAKMLGAAAVVLDEKMATADQLLLEIQKLIQNAELRERMAKQLPSLLLTDTASEIINQIKKTLHD